MKWIILIVTMAGWFVYNYSQTPSVGEARARAATRKAGVEPSVTVSVNKFYRDGEFIKVVGILKNESDAPVGAQVKFTCYNSKGEVVKVNQQWPASVRNIPARGKYTFETMFGAYPGIKRMESEVIEVRKW